MKRYRKKDQPMIARLLPKAAPIALLLAALPLAAMTQAQETRAPKALREAPLTETAPAPEVMRQSTPTAGFGRAYRQQPPLIPHNVDGYEVTFANNKCMECHDWPGNSRFNAPKISETHYVDRAGVRLDKVAGTRYFCNQCHVPQIDAKPLVGNAFQNAIQVK